MLASGQTGRQNKWSTGRKVVDFNVTGGPNIIAEAPLSKEGGVDKLIHEGCLKKVLVFDQTIVRLTHGLLWFTVSPVLTVNETSIIRHWKSLECLCITAKKYCPWQWTIEKSNNDYVIQKEEILVLSLIPTMLQLLLTMALMYRE